MQNELGQTHTLLKGFEFVQNVLTNFVNFWKILGKYRKMDGILLADTFVEGEKLQHVNHFNYLGVKLKDTLSIKLHAAEIIRMVAHIILSD